MKTSFNHEFFMWGKWKVDKFIPREQKLREYTASKPAGQRIIK